MTATNTTCRMTVEALQRRLLKDPVARERALKVLFYQQTATEQASQTTVEDNGVGFTGTDAGLLTSFAEQMIKNRGGYPDGKRLSPKQHAILAKKITKYAAQLLRLSGVPVRRAKKVPTLGQMAMEGEATMHRLEAERGD